MYCGDLDRYVELTGDGGAAVRQRSGLRPGRRTSTASSRAAGSRRRSRSPRSPSPRRDRSATRTGSPTRSGSRGWRSRRRTCAARSRPGTRASPSCASTASSSSKASSPATRPACTPPTASPRPRWCCSPTPSRAFQRAGNVPQLIITLASVPALFERLDRPAPAAMLLGALSREPSSFHHVPELAELGDRVSRTLGTTRAAELTAEGAALDLGDAAVYARQQIDVARRDPSPRARQARPGGLSRREIEVLRLVADGRTAGEIADAAVHLVEDRRAPHPAHLHEDRRLQPRRGDPLGRQAPGRRRRRRADRPTTRNGRRKWVGLPMPRPAAHPENDPYADRTGRRKRDPQRSIPEREQS